MPLPDKYGDHQASLKEAPRCVPEFLNVGLTTTTEKRDLEEREEAAVAATTVTITQTTYTVTQTDVTTLPAQTTTEIAFETVTTTVYVVMPKRSCLPREKPRKLTCGSQPPPTTVCQGGGEAVVITVNPNGDAVTQTNLVYETSYLSGTVWVG